MNITTRTRSVLASVLMASFVAPAVLACGGAPADESAEIESAIWATPAPSPPPVCEHHEWQDGAFTHEQPLDPASNSEVAMFVDSITQPSSGYGGSSSGGGGYIPPGGYGFEMAEDGMIGAQAQYTWVLKLLWVGGKYGVKYAPKLSKFALNLFTGFKYFKLAAQASRLAIRAHRLGLSAARNRFILYAVKKGALGAVELSTGIGVAVEVYNALAKDIEDAKARGECVDEDMKTLKMLGEKIEEAKQHEKELKELIDTLKKVDTKDATEAPEPPARNPGESEDEYDLRLVKWLREVEAGK